MSKKEIRFAVKSKHFSIYKAFAEELEHLGYEWNSKFNELSKRVFECTSCIFVSTGFSYNYGIPQMSFSNPTSDAEVIDLDKHFGDAVAYAERALKSFKEVQPIRVHLNESYEAEVYEDRIVVGCQTIPAASVKALFDAAKAKGLI